VVDGLGHQFLAGAGLSQDENRGVRGGNLPDGAVQGLDLGAFADDQGDAFLALHLAFQVQDLLAQPPFFQGLAHQDAHFFDLVGLGEVMVGPFLHSLHCGSDGGVAGDHDHFGIRIELLGALQDLEAVHLLHPEIGHHQIELPFFQFLESQLPGFHRHGVVALLAQDVVQVLPGDELIFHDQDPGALHGDSLFSLSWGL
jgi:hypothetical protein